jgi:large subunit ribosomal protein LP2
MRYVAAYLLASLKGESPDAATIEKILGSVGIEVDDERLKQVLKSLEGKSLDEVIEAGRARLGSVPCGGGGAAPAAGGAAPAGDAAPAVEEKKEEKKEESEEESDEDMGFGLFD